MRLREPLLVKMCGLGYSVAAGRGRHKPQMAGCHPSRRSAAMKSANQLVVLAVGIGLGVVGSMIFGGPANSLQARPNDRFEDYVMCTGACAVNPRAPSDGVWLLDYKNG